MQLGCHRLISQDAPAGPQNAVEANGWLAFLVSRLGGVMVDRVIRNFEHGVCGYSDFSGFDSWRVGVGKLFKMVSPSCEMHFLRACDVGFLQQDALRWLSFELDRGKACLFPNLADRLPEESKSLIAVFTHTLGKQSQTPMINFRRILMPIANGFSPVALHAVFG